MSKYIKQITINNTCVVIETKKGFTPGTLSGSKFANILGLAYGHLRGMLGILKCDPFIENKFTKTGKLMEPLIFDYFNSKHNGDYFKLEMDRKYCPSVFPSSIVTGEPDGLCLREDTMDILEIKTAFEFGKVLKNYVWKGEIPEYYKLQVLLYVSEIMLSWGRKLKSYSFVFYKTNVELLDYCEAMEDGEEIDKSKFNENNITIIKSEITDEDLIYAFEKRKEALDIIESCKKSKTKWVINYSSTDEMDVKALESLKTYAEDNKIKVTIGE